MRRLTARPTRRSVTCWPPTLPPATPGLHRCADEPWAAANAKSIVSTICTAQGNSGQRWWHYGSHTGRVVWEAIGFTSSHQYAMAPMDLFDPAEARDRLISMRFVRVALDRDALLKQVINMILEQPLVVWLKVARSDPGWYLDHRQSKQSGLTGDTDLTSESGVAGDDLPVVKCSRDTREDRRKHGPGSGAADRGRQGRHFPRTDERTGEDIATLDRAGRIGRVPGSRTARRH